jgi:unsaturated rhamnogalacturonyl hydrolase
MKPYRNLFIGLIAVLAVLPSCKTNTKSNVNDSVGTPWSVRMANSEMKRFPSLWMVDFQTEKRWNYTQGLEGLAFIRLSEVTGNKVYFNYAKGFADSLINADGKILNYKMSNYNIDQVNPGRMMLLLYDQTNDPRYKKVIDTLRQQLRTQPRTPEGGFWHKKIYPNQMWLDGLYMGEPFYAEYAKRYNEPEAFTDIINQFRLAAAHTYDPATGLYRHAWDSSKEMPWADKITGQSPHAWGRAMGWFSMAIVDALDYIPADQPGREDLIAILNTLVEGLVKIQDPSTGGWYQVLDRSGEQGNYIETSCTSMFAYSILKGVRKGYLNEKYLVNARMAYQGLIKNFITTDENGTVSLSKVCRVAGLGGNPYRDGSYEYYINEEIRDNDPKGVAPFIMASIEYESIME